MTATKFMSNLIRKFKCLVIGHDLKTQVIEGERTLSLGKERSLQHTYRTVVDVQLVCKHCGKVMDRESLML